MERGGHPLRLAFFMVFGLFLAKMASATPKTKDECVQSLASAKQEFTDVYTQPDPSGYLGAMRKLDYRIAPNTSPLYKIIAEHLKAAGKNPVRILDVGSSYGIHSALMRYQIPLDSLTNFFDPRFNRSQGDVEKFISSFPPVEDLEFSQIDLSGPANQFSVRYSLARRAHSVNLEEEGMVLASKLAASVGEGDLVISSGGVGYFGHKSFEALLSAAPHRPVFSFSVIRSFSMNKVHQVFKNHGYDLMRANFLIYQRRFSNSSERNQMISLVKRNGFKTAGLEEEGVLLARFYVAVPKEKASEAEQWMQEIASYAREHAEPNYIFSR